VKLWNGVPRFTSYREFTSLHLSRVARSPWHAFALGHCTMLVEFGCECQLWEGGMKCEPPKHVAPAGQASQLPLRGLREKVAAGHVEHIAAFCWTWPVVQFCTYTIFHAAGTCKFRCVQSFDSMGVWLALSHATASVPQGLKHACWHSQTCLKLMPSRPCKDEMPCVT